MSALPSGAPNGASNGQPPTSRPPPHPLKKRRPVDPLVARRRPVPKPRPTPPVDSNAPLASKAPVLGGPSKLSRNSSAGSHASQDLASLEALRKKNGGWSEPPPPGQYHDFPIVTTKKALREGIRYHIMRFHQASMNDKPVDPTDSEQFTRPVTLQRRDPRQPPAGRLAKEETPPPVEAPDEAEAERLAQIKAEKEAQKAIDQAKIAPGSKEAAVKRPPKKQKEKPMQFNRGPRTDAQRKEADLRYEEALPWHLEDADGKNVWVAQYIAQLSETNVAFVIDGATFRMIPLEKQYKMLAKPPFKPYSIEEAENLMKDTSRTGGVSRWHHRHAQKMQAEEEMKQTRAMFGGKSRVKRESNTFKSASRAEKMDHDELDMEGDEFQDDDENPGFEYENDEDNKESMDRVRRNQLGANLFGDADEQEVDKEEAEIKREEEERKQLGKKIKKALINGEKQLAYADDDSDKDPFASSSSDDEKDSDEEKKEDQDDDADKSKAKTESKEPAASGTSSKGNTTPSGKAKSIETLKKSKTLKRPGSPNLSESSGNESSRKKKIKKQTASVQQSRSTTPLPPSQRLKGNSGSGSDGEATAGEMSDGQPRKKKIKLLNPAARGTPVGSRAGSPVPAASNHASPSKDGASPRASSPLGTVEPWEIVQAIPPNGITIGGLLRVFEGRVGEEPGKMPRKDWIAMIKANSHYGADKLLRRKQ